MPLRSFTRKARPGRQPPDAPFCALRSPSESAPARALVGQRDFEEIDRGAHRGAVRTDVNAEAGLLSRGELEAVHQRDLDIRRDRGEQDRRPRRSAHERGRAAKRRSNTDPLDVDQRPDETEAGEHDQPRDHEERCSDRGPDDQDRIGSKQPAPGQRPQRPPQRYSLVPVQVMTNDAVEDARV